MARKRIWLLALTAVLACTQSAAQLSRPLRKVKRTLNRPANCANFYLTVSSGYNNNTDLAGVSLDAPVTKLVSAAAGLGYGLWGIRAYLGGKYFLARCQRGLAFGGGLTYNTGVKDYQAQMATTAGYKEEVQIDLHSQLNGFAAVYYYWNVGRKSNRLYAEGGWSLPLTGVNYSQVGGDPITSGDRQKLNSMAPGGPVIGVGFSFGVTN